MRARRWSTSVPVMTVPLTIAVALRTEVLVSPRKFGLLGRLSPPMDDAPCAGARAPAVAAAAGAAVAVAAAWAGGAAGRVRGALAAWPTTANVAEMPASSIAALW